MVSIRFISGPFRLVSGCSFCRKHFGTVEQFKRHITEDVIPPLLDELPRKSHRYKSGLLGG